MTNKEIKIAYREYESLAQLEVEDKELAQAAIEATAQSYAPYSNFNVGAAVLFEDGVVVKGANQENAAYPSGLCAERTALFYASASRPDKAMTAIAIAAGQNGELCKNPATPCGACRQTLLDAEKRQQSAIRIIMSSRTTATVVGSAEALLPFSFKL